MELARWLNGTFSEVEFWKVWMRSRGAERPEEFRQRLRDDIPLDRQLLRRQLGRRPRTNE